MVGWRTAGAGRMEDGKERDLNQSSSKMDGVGRGREGGREGSIEVEAVRRVQEKGRSAGRKDGFSWSCEGKMGGGPAGFSGPLPVLPAAHPASVVQ